MIDLPPAIATFFAASADSTRASFETCFTADAIAQDEGETHQGIEALKAWHIKASGPNPVHKRVLSIREEGGKTIVAAEISGAFKGSPVILDFTFTLKGGLIAALSIH